jgi:glycosidase
MTGAADPDNRRPMRFGDKVSEYEKEMNRVVKKLIGIRRDHPALRYGDFLPLHVDKDSYVFMRSTLNERILVALNKSDQSQKISLNLPELYNITGAVNLLNAEKTSINNSRILVDIEGMGWKIYILSSGKSLN